MLLMVSSPTWISCRLKCELKFRSLFVVLLLCDGKCYEAEICTILLLLRRSFRWYPFFPKVKLFRFWPKTMDYSQAFCPKLSSFFMFLLLLTGR